MQSTAKLLALLLLAAANPAWTAGLEIAKIIPNQPEQLVRVLPGVFDNAVQTALDEGRGRIESELKNRLGRGDLIASGFTLYDLNVALGTGQLRFIDANTLGYELKGNHVYAKSTLPGPAGSYADPAFEVNFDVRVLLSLQPPDLDSPRLVFNRAVMSVPWIELKPRNVVGDVATTFATVVNAFNKAVTGRDLIQAVVQPYLTREFTEGLNGSRRLADVNAVLANLKRRDGFDARELRLDRARQMLQVRVTGPEIKVPTSSTAQATAPGAAAQALRPEVKRPTAPSTSGQTAGTTLPNRSALGR